VIPDEQIQKEISDLSKKRNNYVAQKQTENGNMLDKAILATIKKQAVAKNFEFVN